MKYLDIKQKLTNLKIFSIEDLVLVDPNFRLETLYEWEGKNWVVRLRNKRYIFSDFIPANNDFYLLANKIYSPSYISLEMALNHYGIIPEAVRRITSVTTNKTAEFSTKVGVFDYKSIDSKLFFGYQLIKYGDLTYKIASLEKAILDFFYLNANITSLADLEGFRFNVDILHSALKVDELNKMLVFVDSPTLTRKVDLLINYIKQ